MGQHDGNEGSDGGGDGLLSKGVWARMVEWTYAASEYTLSIERWSQRREGTY